MFTQGKGKTVPQNVLDGAQGENLVAARANAMGFVFHGLNRLEAGIDGMLELRDPATGRMLGRWIGVQIKTTRSGSYTREDDHGFERLLDPADLEYWRITDIPVVIVYVRLSDDTMWWKAVDAGPASEPRRLTFDKNTDAFNAGAADDIANLTIAKDAYGTFVPPMIKGEEAHLNLVRLKLPPEIFVGESLFKSGRNAVREMHKFEGERHYDWVVRDRSFWSFRDPRGTILEEIVDGETIEAIDTEEIAELDDVDQQNAFIELLRRSVEAQLREDLLFNRDARALYFRAPGPGAKRTYEYRSLQNNTSAEVVSLIEKEGYDAIMRHHAFVPRYLRVGDDWYVSITPTFVFTGDGYSSHPASSIMLAGKKKLEKAAAIRGQFVMWRHLLSASGVVPSSDLLTEDESDPLGRPRIGFEGIDPVIVPLSVPERSWEKDKDKDDEDGANQTGDEAEAEASAGNAVLL